jgi:hypothetical protein
MECRAKASDCRLLAERIHAAEAAKDLLDLARDWDHLATQIEHDERLLALIKELASGPQKIERQIAA